MIYIVIHGQREDGPNPALTEQGHWEMKQVKKGLPQYGPFSRVEFGEGLRHYESMMESGQGNHPDRRMNRLWGGAAVFTPATGGVVTLASNHSFHHDPTSDLEMAPAIIRALRHRPDQILIFGGRETIRCLTGDSGRIRTCSGCVYKVGFQGRKPTVELVFDPDPP